MKPSEIIPPTEPMRLMMAFALLRKGLGVTSGIKLTAGVRKEAMATRTIRRTLMNTTNNVGSTEVILLKIKSRRATVANSFAANMELAPLNV
jgi:hypothetical protein